MLSLTLRTIPVGVAYAVWCGVGMALISLIGWVVLKQKLDAGAMTSYSYNFPIQRVRDLFHEQNKPDYYLSLIHI